MQPNVGPSAVWLQRVDLCLEFPLTNWESKAARDTQMVVCAHIGDRRWWVYVQVCMHM